MSSIVFVDSRVQDRERLLVGLAADVQVFILDPTQDGITQIAAALAGITDLDSIHIVSHGSSGTLYLGSTVLTEENIDEYQTRLSQIGASLTDTGDILLYGCDVGAGATGQSLIASLAAYTGADVAASTDYTGSAALGGDWVLETNTGAIETQTVTPDSFDALLAAPILTPAGTLDTSFDTDGQLTTAIGADYDSVSSMVLQADGKIVVAGYRPNGGNNDFVLARYNADGSLDTTFDGDGKLTTTFGLSDDQIYSVALQGDGRIVVAGYSYNGANLDFALARYNPDGSLDTTFDGDGKLTTAIGTGDDFAKSIVLQADGKIVVAGSSFNGTNNDFALARYNLDGSLDTTFDGDGKLTTTIGTVGSGANSMALQADGKIVVVGSSFNGVNNDFALARYNPNGSLDTTFDGDGKLTTAFGAGDNFAFSVALQADGKIVVAGQIWNGADYDFSLARYNLDGSLDATFDGNGKLTIAVGASGDAAQSVLVQPDGAIVVAGYSVNGSNYDFAVVRLVGGPGIPDVATTENAAFSFAFNATTFADPESGALTYTTSALPAWLTFNAATRTFSGTPGDAAVGTVNVTVTATDPEFLSVNDSFVITVQNNDPPVLTVGVLDITFDGDGKLTTAIGSSTDQINSVAMQADGKIVVAGYSFNGGVSGDDFTLARYNPDGSLDTAFDGDGKLATTIYDRVNSLVVQADGKIVAAGYRLGPTYDFALTRFNADGSLDTTFSGDGQLLTSIGAGDEKANSVALQADGKILAAGYSFNSVNDDFALVRYNTNGNLDTTFDGDGKLITAIGTGGDVANSMVLQPDGKIVVAGYSWNGANYDFALLIPA